MVKATKDDKIRERKALRALVADGYMMKFIKERSVEQRQYEGRKII